MKYRVNSQAVLLIIAAFLAILIPFDREVVFFLLIWQSITGVIQLLYAIYLTISEWSVKKFREAIGYYWLAVVGCLALLLQISKTLHGNTFWLIVIVFIIPWSIAIYFTMLTYKLPYYKK